MGAATLIAAFALGEAGEPPVARKPTFKEMQAQFRAREAYVRQKVEELRGARSVRFKEREGVRYPVGDIIVSPSTSEAGQWQLTWFTKDGDPMGHGLYPDFDQAVSSAMGQFTKSNGPPHGNSNFEPVEVMRSKAKDVIESSGRIGPVYHGTAEDFTDDFRAVRPHPRLNPHTGEVVRNAVGIYFSDTPKGTEAYGDNLITAYLHLRNPYYSKGEYMALISPARRDQLVQQGYDSVIWRKLDGSTEYIVFDPRQIERISSNVAESSSHVPKGFQIDPEFGCMTNAERLASANPKLHYVEGWARLRAGKDRRWGAHAWCETASGEVVDPYFQWRLQGRAVEYRRAKEGESPFD